MLIFFILSLFLIERSKSKFFSLRTLKKSQPTYYKFLIEKNDADSVIQLQTYYNVLFDSELKSSELGDALREFFSVDLSEVKKSGVFVGQESQNYQEIKQKQYDEILHKFRPVTQDNIEQVFLECTKVVKNLVRAIADDIINNKVEELSITNDVGDFLGQHTNSDSFETLKQINSEFTQELKVMTTRMVEYLSTKKAEFQAIKFLILKLIQLELTEGHSSNHVEKVKTLLKFYLQHKPSGDVKSLHIGERIIEQSSNSFNRDEKDELYHNLVMFKDELNGRQDLEVQLGQIISVLLEEGLKFDPNLPAEYFEQKFLDEKLSFAASAELKELILNKTMNLTLEQVESNEQNKLIVYDLIVNCDAKSENDNYRQAVRKFAPLLAQLVSLSQSSKATIFISNLLSNSSCLKEVNLDQLYLQSIDFRNVSHPELTKAEEFLDKFYTQTISKSNSVTLNDLIPFFVGFAFTKDKEFKLNLNDKQIIKDEKDFKCVLTQTFKLAKVIIEKSTDVFSEAQKQNFEALTAKPNPKKYMEAVNLVYQNVENIQPEWIFEAFGLKGNKVSIQNVQMQQRKKVNISKQVRENSISKMSQEESEPENRDTLFKNLEPINEIPQVDDLRKSHVDESKEESVEEPIENKLPSEKSEQSVHKNESVDHKEDVKIPSIKKIESIHSEEDLKSQSIEQIKSIHSDEEESQSFEEIKPIQNEDKEESESFEEIKPIQNEDKEESESFEVIKSHSDEEIKIIDNNKEKSIESESIEEDKPVDDLVTPQEKNILIVHGHLSEQDRDFLENSTVSEIMDKIYSNNSNYIYVDPVASPCHKDDYFN